MSVAAHFTREEYLTLPESPPGVRFELLDGELVTMNDPLPLHQIVVGAIYVALLSWVSGPEGHGRVIMPIDTALGPDTVFGPDLQWFSGGRDLPSLRERPWPVGDLVIEVASPSTARYDLEVKVGRYLDAGASEVWIVQPDPLEARICRRDPSKTDSAVRVGADGVLSSPLLPGLAVPLRGLDD